MNLTAKTEDLWHKDATVRLCAVECFHKAVLEMEDIRHAQPALTLLLADPDPRVKRAALLTIEYRARLGADIGLAVPMLESLLSDDDEEIKETAWETIQCADRRLPGIVDIIEIRRPEFVFSRATRTTVCPKDGPTGVSEGIGLAEKRAKEPYATPEGRHFFEMLFLGSDIDRRTEEALSCDEDFNSIRAAAYLLEILGFLDIWPGDPKNLQNLTERAVFLLKKMIGSKPEAHRFITGDILVSVEKQIIVLSSRIL